MNPIPLPQLNTYTHSRISAFLACPKKHEFMYERGLRTASPAKALRMGNAFHLGLDARAQGKSHDEAWEAAVAAYEELPAWASTEEHLAAWALEREIVGRLLMAYFWFYESATIDPALTVAEVIETEQAFSTQIPGMRGVRLAGKMDKVVRLGDGRLAVMEHKTCSESLEPGSNYWRRLAIDAQIDRYFAVALQKHDVACVLYDVVRKPEIEPKLIPLLDDNNLKIVLDADGQRVFNKDGTTPRQTGDTEKGYVLQTRRETVEEFGERLTTDICERPAWYFARREIPRSEKENWAEDTQDAIDAIRRARKSGRWLRNTGACLTYGTCPYFDLCTSRADPQRGEPAPAGFVWADDIHPELEGAIK